jgi:uncharacterized Ntn-hydrolase superfamily protein
MFRRLLTLAAVLWLAPAMVHATFSICAIDPATGQSGVAVTTRVPFVGRAVPWARADVGAVATQSWTVVEYGNDGLDLLEQGFTPMEVLDRLLEDDEGRALRQIGMINMMGRTAAHTGGKNGDWAGSRQGKNYTVQGNVLVGQKVIDAVGEHFEVTEGTGMPLAERLILALEAGQAAGGDKRWGYLQSAAIRVADPDTPGRGGDHLAVSIDVGENEHPVAEMKRIYYTTSRRLGYRDFSAVQGDDVVELKRMLHALKYWRAKMKSFPEAPEFDFPPEKMRSDPDGFQAYIEEYRALAQAYDDKWSAYDAEAIKAVDAFREDRGLVFEGDAPGLVDARLVDALRAAYYGWAAIAGETPAE